MVVNSTISKMNAPVLRRLKKSSSTVGSVPTFKIVVFGQSGVGKTAMSVRFVTKRFIGEYDPTLENIYQHYFGVSGGCVLFEIMDTAGQEENDMMMEEKIRWADAFILVYAINDRTSFDEIPRLKFTISHTMARLSHQHKQVQPQPVITIVGNKADLEPDRMVGRTDGENVARSMNCGFQEISVRDDVSDVMDVFWDTYESHKRRTAMFHCLSDSNGSLLRRKKSFKHVDRIPRMQGKRRGYTPFDADFSGGRNHVACDVTNSSDIMTSKIDEDSAMIENIPRRQLLRSASTPPVDVCPSPPPGRSRRNALVQLGSGLVAKDSNFHGRQKLLTRNSDTALPNGCNDLQGRSDDGTPKVNRRCRSQEQMSLGSVSMLESFTKRAVSFDVSNGLAKRVT